MSDPFERRVTNATGQLLGDRYKILKKLDPELAEIYAVGINKNNKQRIAAGRPLTGFGKISKKDVDEILEAALDDWSITADEEEALLIILETRSALAWEPGAKEYMIDQLQTNLNELWSSVRIDDQVATLLSCANFLDFVSEGQKHLGTGFHYTPVEYQAIAGLIDRLKIGAWEVPATRSWLRMPPGQAGAWGFYDSVTDDIYIIKGLGSRDRQASFTHEATHAIQDWRNFSHKRSLAKFVEADCYIAQAFVALRLGMPYTGQPKRPEDVACRERPTPGAARMLLTPLASRDKAWKAAFKVAYDDVVDAFAALPGSRPDEIIDVLEDKKRQKREGELVMGMLKSLKKKP
jgi:hypothetical protein